MIGLMEHPVSGERFVVSAENLGYREVFNMMADGFGKKRPHLKVSPLLASIVWRLVKIKSLDHRGRAIAYKGNRRNRPAKSIF